MQIQILHPKIDPKYATSGAAAFDLQANLSVPMEFKAQDVRAVPTGIKLWLKDPSLAGLVLPRSGLGKKGLIIANGTGLIDSDYQGEIIVNLWNRTANTMFVHPFDRIAQYVIIPVLRPKLQVVTEFSDTTERGEGGFGSTGQ